MRIHKAVQGRKGDEASAGESPVVATGMMILERSEPMDHGSDFVFTVICLESIVDMGASV